MRNTPLHTENSILLRSGKTTAVKRIVNEFVDMEAFEIVKEF